jgi:hypothetical protein
MFHVFLAGLAGLAGLAAMRLRQKKRPLGGTTPALQCGKGQMKAFVVRHPGDEEGEVHCVDVPRPKEGEALIRVLRAGVCNTDIEIMKVARRGGGAGGG